MIWSMPYSLTVPPGFTSSELLYEGEKSRVVRATREADEQVFVLKMPVRPQAAAQRTRYRLEFEIGSRIDHPQVRRYHDVVPLMNHWVLVQQDVPGRRLDEVIPESGFELRPFLRIVLQVVKGLAAIHRQGIIHKGIHPQNLLYDAASKAVWIIDFSAATRVPREHPGAAPWRPGGRPAFMSPEQSGRMNRSLDHRSDFYSLGITCFQMLAGRVPFTAEGMEDWIQNHITAPPPSLAKLRPDLPAAVVAVVDKLLAKDPEDRYFSARGLRRDLERCLRELRWTGDVSNFPLAEEDKPLKFHLPERIYGRDPQSRAILSTFKQAAFAATGPSRHTVMLLVSGAPGIGKSALIHELQRDLTGHQGVFVVGKCGQYLRGRPYSALAQALDSFCSHLLNGSPAALADWRRRIDHVVGPRDRVLLDLVPSLEFVLGPRPSRPLAPRETESRLHRALIKFLRAVSRPDFPLVIFLDNLQWADQACLRLLEAMATREAVPHLFLLGAFRDTEVDSGHPLSATLERIESKVGSVSLLKLDELNISNINRLLSDTLSCSPAASRPLAELVHAKTGGNPLFAREFLQSLSAEGLIRLRRGGAPQWDLDKIRARSATADLVQWVSSKIDTLPRETKGALRWAACLGGTFHFATLAAVYERPNGPSAAAALWPAIEANLVLPLDEHYLALSSASTSDDVPPGCRLRFAHDRIQQAAYFSLPEDARAALHLRIGRYYTRTSRPPGHLLFEVVEHYNLGRRRLRDPDEKARLAEIYLKAGAQAKDSAAYGDAVRYIRQGIRLLGGDPWANRRELTYTLHRQLLESLILATRFPAADELFGTLISLCDAVDEQTDLMLLYLEGLLVQERNQEAIDLAAETLALCDEPCPTGDDCHGLLNGELARLEELMAERRPEELAAIPKTHDRRLRLVTRLLADISSGAYSLGRTDLLAWSAARRVNLSIQFGHTELAPMNYAGYAFATAIPMRRDYHAALSFGALAMRLLDERTHPWARARTLTMYAGGILPWHRHLKHSVEPLSQALGICLDSGDLTFAQFSLWFLLGHRFMAGEPLGDLRAEIDTQLGYLERSYATRLKAGLRPGLLQPIAALTGRTRAPHRFDDDTLGDDAFDEAAFLADPAVTPYARAIFHASKIRQLYWFDEIEEALGHVEQYAEIRRVVPTQPVVAEAVLFTGLVLTRALSERPDDEAARHWGRLLDQIEPLLEHWSSSCAANFAHKAALIRGERARLADDLRGAVAAFREAAEQAERHGFLQYQALASELQARLWMDIGDPDAAGVHLQRAVRLYERWGATAKADRLHGLCPVAEPEPELPERPASTPKGDLLDLDAILNACRTVSKEVRLERLLQTLLAVALEHVEADRGVLLTNADGRLQVAAELDSAAALPVVGKAVPIGHYPHICRAAALYVFRTHDEVVIEDSRTGSKFATDPRLLSGEVLSLACLPLRSHDQTRGVIYLENVHHGSRSKEPFPESRLAGLRIILGQSAFSLENAHLYESLTREISERRQTEERLKSYTGELESKNAELERFSYTVSHDLKSPLVTIKGFLGLLREDSQAGRLDAMDADIQRISDAADRMHELLSDLLELSRVGRLVHPPSLFPLTALVQETADLMAGPLDQGGVELVMADDFPTVSADRTRLREVFQNLIENAVKFMGDEPTPRIEIGWVPQEPPVFFVRDNGIGIAPQHQDVIFGLFEQLDQRKEGTGVGLALVRRIVRVHGGRLWLESEGEGHGATFFFTLQAEETEDDPESTESTEPTGATPRLQGSPS